MVVRSLCPSENWRNNWGQLSAWPWSPNGASQARVTRYDAISLRLLVGQGSPWKTRCQNPGRNATHDPAILQRRFCPPTRRHRTINGWRDIPFCPRIDALRVHGGAADIVILRETELLEPCGMRRDIRGQFVAPAAITFRDTPTLPPPMTVIRARVITALLTGVSVGRSISRALYSSFEPPTPQAQAPLA